MAAHISAYSEARWFGPRKREALMRNLVTIDPQTVGWIEVYRRMTEIVVPRPIAVVSTVDDTGRPNLAPFSFFTVVSANPPHIAFSPQLAGRTGAKKDTLRNIEVTGQFVVATATEDLAEAVNSCAAQLPYGQSEFDHSGLTAAPASRVAPHLVAESPVNLECELVEIRTYGDQGGAGNLVVGRVVLMHIDKSTVGDTGAVLPDRLRAVGRMGGEDWVRTRETFPMPRPS
jgi:flavin reductase (DIM6/NTAB) family NADH-FMN oxidoreductase RutF